MKILITGAAGTIGTRLCERFLESGAEVVGVDRRPCEWNPEVNAITKQADLLDPHALDTFDTDFDIVIHLAANARVYDLVTDPSRALENMVSTFNTLDWARRNNITKFMFASSRECYGNIAAEVCTEDMVRIEECESAYTASKLSGEALVEAYGRCYGMKNVILRFSNVFGAYDTSDRVIPLFIRKCRKNEPLTIFGKEKRLDFTYIDDTVAGIMLATENMDTVYGETFNIATGTSFTIVELAEYLKELLGSSSEISYAPSRTGEVTRYTADITKARTKLGYEPKVTFHEGVQKAVEWYTKNIN